MNRKWDGKKRINFETVAGVWKRLLVACVPVICATHWASPLWGQWSSGSGGAIYYNGGNVGIGTASPNQRLQVNGNVLFSITPTATIYTSAPLNLANNGAPGTLKTQLNLINGAGAANAGSAIDFYTYTDAGNGNPGARFSAIDDGQYSGSFVGSEREFVRRCHFTRLSSRCGPR